MARIAFGLSLSIGGVAAWLVLDELSYLAPYRDALVREHGLVIVAYCGALACNCFALLYALCRRLGLGDAGRKLRRLEREVQRGRTFNEEVADRLRLQRQGEA